MTSEGLYPRSRGAQWPRRSLSVHDLSRVPECSVRCRSLLPPLLRSPWRIRQTAEASRKRNNLMNETGHDVRMRKCCTSKAFLILTLCSSKLHFQVCPSPPPSKSLKDFSDFKETRRFWQCITYCYKNGRDKILLST